MSGFSVLSKRGWFRVSLQPRRIKGRIMEENIEKKSSVWDDPWVIASSIMAIALLIFATVSAFRNEYAEGCFYLLLIVLIEIRYGRKAR